MSVFKHVTEHTVLTSLFVTAHIHVTLVTLVLVKKKKNAVFSQFAQLINSQKRLGSDKFPVIDQTFYPNYRDMVRAPVLYSYLFVVQVQVYLCLFVTKVLP